PDWPFWKGMWEFSIMGSPAAKRLGSTADCDGVVSTVQGARSSASGSTAAQFARAALIPARLPAPRSPLFQSTIYRRSAGGDGRTAAAQKRREGAPLLECFQQAEYRDLQKRWLRLCPTKNPGRFRHRAQLHLISFRQVARRDVFGKNNRQEQSSRIIV